MGPYEPQNFSMTNATPPIIRANLFNLGMKSRAIDHRVHAGCDVAGYIWDVNLDMVTMYRYNHTNISLKNQIRRNWKC